MFLSYHSFKRIELGIKLKLKRTRKHETTQRKVKQVPNRDLSPKRIAKRLLKP